jgi:hypothetical protein
MRRYPAVVVGAFGPELARWRSLAGGRLFRVARLLGDVSAQMGVAARRSLDDAQLYLTALAESASRNGPLSDYEWLRSWRRTLETPRTVICDCWHLGASADAVKVFREARRELDDLVDEAEAWVGCLAATSDRGVG